MTVVIELTDKEVEKLAEKIAPIESEDDAVYAIHVMIESV